MHPFLGKDQTLRRLMAASAVVNLAGAVLFAFPGSALGQLAGLPAETSPLYRGLVVLFVLLFAGMYAWLSRQDPVPRPAVCLAAIGKSSAFLLVLALWLMDEAPARLVVAISADLLLAAYYLVWLHDSTRR